MNATPFPAKLANASSGRSHRLNEIARILGISVDALSAPAQPHIFHSNNEGICWKLVIDRQDTFFVECSKSLGDQRMTKESVSSFLARNIGSPQHKALIRLIDHLIMTQIIG